MGINLYCPNCGRCVGYCGHRPGGLTTPITISGTCICKQPFSVTCYGDCLKEKSTEKPDRV